MALQELQAMQNAWVPNTLWTFHIPHPSMGNGFGRIHAHQVMENRNRL